MGLDQRLVTLSVCGAAALAACGSTTVLSSWKAPGPPPTFHKMLVVAASKDPSLRRAAEDDFAARNANVTPSYQVIPENEIGNAEAIRARVKAGGFDGAVVMRVTSVDKEQSWVPGGWGYSYWPGGLWAEPGYMQTDTRVRVETNVYSVPDDRLVWSSATQTVNTASVRSLVKDTAVAVDKEMRKQGFVP